MVLRQRPSARAECAVLFLIATTILATEAYTSNSALLSKNTQAGRGRALLQAEGGGPASAPSGSTASNVTTSLLLLKAAVDPNGTLSDWNTNTSYCNWQGVQCNAEGQPVTLKLQNKDLQGQLPLDTSVWASLKTLRVVDVSGNNVTGFVPPQLAEVQGLTNLSLANNGFQGNLPNLTASNMQSINTRGNQLTGGIPASWGNLTDLRTVDVSNNRLSGSLPSTWSNLTNARYMNFSANNLEGQIPGDWRVSTTDNGTVDAGLTGLQFVGFGGNPSLCSGSNNGGGFLWPNSYNLPCSSPNVISLAPPVLAPGSSPAGVPAVSPAVEVPVTSPAAAPIAGLLAQGPDTVRAFSTPAEAPSVEDVSNRLPTESPTESPAESPTDSPAESPTESPAESPTESPAESPTESPAESLTESPTALPVLPSPGEAPGLSPEGSLSPSESSPVASPELVPTAGPELSPAFSPGPDVLPVLPFAPELSPAPSPEELAAPAPVPVPEEVGVPAPVPAEPPIPVPEEAGVPAPVPAEPPIPVPSPEEAPAPVPAEPPVPVPSPEEAPVPGPAEPPVPIPSPEEVPAPGPAPEEVAAAAPVPAPAPSVVAAASPPDVAARLASVPPAPPPQGNGVTVTFNPNQVSTPPSSAPSTGITTNLTATGANRNQFLQTILSPYRNVISNVTGQPVDHVNVTNVRDVPLPSPTATTGRRLQEIDRRRLLQLTQGIGIDTKVASTDPSGTQQRYNQAVQSGELRQQLRAIGLDLVDTSVVNADSSSTPPTPIDGGGGGHSAGWYLVRILPAVLGGLLAIILVALIAWCCLVRRRKGQKSNALRPSASSQQPGAPIFESQPGSSRARATGAPKPTPTRGGNTSLAEGLMFSHKPNPIFDTNETQSSRGDDYEVINLSNGAGRHGSPGSSISGMPGLMAGENLRWGATVDPPVGDAGLVPRLDLPESQAGPGASAGLAALQTRDALSHPEGDFNPLDTFVSAKAARRGPEYDSGMSYRSAMGPGETQRTAATNEAFVTPHDSPRSQKSETSFNSARSHDRSFRTAGSFTTVKSAQTEFFDTTSRGGSFDYDAYVEDQARAPLPARRVLTHGDTSNPLYGQEEPIQSRGSDDSHPILDNPIFASHTSTPREQSPLRERDADLPSHPVTVSGGVASVEGHPITASGGSYIVDSGDLPQYSVNGHPIVVSGGSIMESGDMRPASVQGHPVTMSGGSIMDSGIMGSGAGQSVTGSRGAPGESALGAHPITVSGGSIMGSGRPGSEQSFLASQPDISDKAEVPAGGPVLTTDKAELPVGGPVLTSDKAEVPAQSVEVTYEKAEVPASGGVQGHPIVMSGGSVMSAASIMSSFKGQPVQLTDGTIVDSATLPPGSLEGHPITFSGGSIMDSGPRSSMRGHPIQLTDGSIVYSSYLPPESLKDHPVASSQNSAMDTGSLQAHPVTASGGSIMDSGVLGSAPGSVHGQPVLASGGGVMESGGSMTPVQTPSGLPPIQEKAVPDTGESSNMPSSAGTTFGDPMGGFQTPPGSVVYRTVVRDTQSSHQSSRSYQAFDFEGQQMKPGEDEGFHYSRDAPMDVEEEYTGPDIDHPHMRESFDSERGNPFISDVHSPSNTQPGDVTGSGGAGQQSQSFQGHPISGSNLDSYQGSAGPASVQGHPLTGSALDSITNSASIRGHPVTGSSLIGSNISSIHGHPVTSSGGVESIQGHPVNSSGGMGSLQGHPITGSSLMGSNISSIHGHPVTSSGGVESIQGHPVSSSGGVGSLQGHPITGSSLMGSNITASNFDSVQGDRPASLQGHPVTYSGGSDLFESGVMGSGFSGRAGSPGGRNQAVHSAPQLGETRAVRPAASYGIQTDNPVYGTSMSGNAGRGFDTSNPIFSSKEAYTSEAEGQGDNQNTHSDIWESGRGRDPRDLSLSGHTTTNPMFGTHGSIAEMLEESPHPQGNPLYDSRRSPSSAGFTTTDTDQPSQGRGSRVSRGHPSENPLYNNENLMETSDSMVPEQNPLYDSTTGQRISADQGQRNALFGSDILDSLDNSQRESDSRNRTGDQQRSKNPLFESSTQRSSQPQTTGTSTLLAESSSSSDHIRPQQLPITAPPSTSSGGGLFSKLFRAPGK